MFNGLNTFPIQAYKQAGLLSGLKTKINLEAILTNTQKTLNIVNQAIPLVYQVKPLVENAKTIFKVIGAVKEADNNNTRTSKINTPPKNNIEEKKTLNNPNFFI